MLGEIVAEIQSLGVRVDKRVLQRRGGAGPAEAGSFLIDGIAVNVPTASPYVSFSPYSLEAGGSHLYLRKDGRDLLPVELTSRPQFYNQTTRDGVPCPEVALLHGKDCLATTVLQTCSYWDSKNRCRFCGIELSLENKQTLLSKTPDQLAEVALKAKELDSVRHVVLTAGTGRPQGMEISILAACSSAIKKSTDLPIHAQFLPPHDPGRLHSLKLSGVDTVGIHIESLDMGVLSRIAPVKASIGLKRYEDIWKTAVKVFGSNQVSSFLIAGLGEKPDSLISGSELLADIGVYPFVVPLRPIPGSLMEDRLPPEPDIMKLIYEKVAVILKEKGLSADRSMAGCVRCGACSALPLYEQPLGGLTCHQARTCAELKAAFDIRNEVFVREQKVFDHSDRDGNDSKSIHLIAKQDQEVVGTVRIFPAGDGNGHWVGGRLAVKKGYRASGVGETLVQNAVAYVKRHGCTRFTAHIQEENVIFFCGLGWKGIEEVKEYLGRPHQLMEADLNR